MSDRLYLTCDVRGFSETTMLGHFETVLAQFPFSKLAKRGPVLRVYAVERSEPPAVEREFGLGASAPAIIGIAREFVHGDCAVELDAAWDLWQLRDEWKLEPAPVTLACFGPRFEDADGQQIRIDFGLDSLFLPNPSIEGSLRMGQSNLRSLVHLVEEIQKVVPLSSRQLMSESGANFADQLSQSLGRFPVN